jgi:hypothetical protein
MNVFGRLLIGGVGAAGLIGFCFYACTQIGLRRAGWHEVVVELPSHPGYGSVGQTFTAPDGAKVLVTSVRRGATGRHLIHARVEGIHRHALAGIPPAFHWEHSFQMDSGGIEWVLRRECGLPVDGLNQAGRRWHLLN